MGNWCVPLQGVDMSEADNPLLANLFSRLGLLGLEFLEGEPSCLVSEEDRFRLGFFARALGGDLGGEGYFF